MTDIYIHALFLFLLVFFIKLRKANSPLTPLNYLIISLMFLLCLLSFAHSIILVTESILQISVARYFQHPFRRFAEITQIMFQPLKDFVIAMGFVALYWHQEGKKKKNVSVMCKRKYAYRSWAFAGSGRVMMLTHSS